MYRGIKYIDHLIKTTHKHTQTKYYLYIYKNVVQHYRLIVVQCNLRCEWCVYFEYNNQRDESTVEQKHHKSRS